MRQNLARVESFVAAMAAEADAIDAAAAEPAPEPAVQLQPADAPRHEERLRVLGGLAQPSEARRVWTNSASHTIAQSNCCARFALAGHGAGLVPPRHLRGR